MPYLEAAVGRPLEWDQVVPYFGRREIVKGSVYSYYEFPSPTPLTDLAWAGKLANPDADPAHPAPADKADTGKVEIPRRIRRGSALSSPGRACHVRQNRPSSRISYRRFARREKLRSPLLPCFAVPMARAQTAPAIFACSLQATS